MDSPQTTFKDAMGSAHSSMSWHDQVIEEEKQGGVVTEEEPEFGSSPDSDTPPWGLREGPPVMSQWLMMDLPNVTQTSW